MSATFAAAPALFADNAPLAVGEISTAVGHEEVVPAMRASLVTNLATVKTAAGKKFIVSASLTKLETKTNGTETTTSCVVSLALRDAKDGALRGSVQGTASFNGAPDATSNAAVVAAAIHGATRGVSEVVKQ